MQDASELVIDGYDVESEDTAKTTKDRVSAFVNDSKDQVVRGAEQVVKAARENPRTAIAAGAAVVVGAIAAAAIPAIRAATKTKPRSTTTAAKRTPARKPAAKTAAKKTSTRRSSAKSGTPAHA